MQEHVTLLGPEKSPADVRGLSSSLPPDLMEQVRGRDGTARVHRGHLNGASPPPRAYTAATTAEQAIPPALDQLVLSCLAKDPTERPQSARELSSWLGEISGAGVWTEDRARDWWSKHQPARN